MTFIKFSLASVLKFCATGLLLLSGFAIAQTRSSVGQFSVNITLNGATTVSAGTCVSQTLFNQVGAVVRVTCVDNPFVSITPSIDIQLPGTFGRTFRYPMFSSSNSPNIVNANIIGFNPVSDGLNSVGVASLFVEESLPTGSNFQGTLGNSRSIRSFNSPTSTITDMTIYRTAPQATTDSQGLMDMVISF